MKSRKKYHALILKRYTDYSSDNVIFDHSYRSSDNLELKSTLFNSSSTTGIMIIPGWSSAREKYYKLALDLNEKFKVMVYDQRGHGYSQGALNIDLMAEDVIAVANQYMEEEKLKKLIIAGHSFGAYISAIASTRIDSDNMAQVLLSLPISLKNTTDKIPSNVTIFQVYLMNMLKAATPRNGGLIFREYFSYWYPKFKKKPYLMAYRVEDVNKVIQEFNNSLPLQSIINDSKIRTLFLWGAKDEKLGINNGNATAYQNFIDTIKQNNCFEYDILLGISHYLTFDSRRTVLWAGDNDLVKNKIIKWTQTG